MPITKSAAKALRRDLKRTKINRATRDQLKKSLDTAKKTPTSATVSQGYRAVDRAAKKHLLHPNKAARLKSQLAKKLAASAPVKVAKVTKAKPAKKTTK